VFRSRPIQITTAAFVAAVVVLIAASLPPRAVRLTARPDNTVAGIFHVHTNRSDGLAGVDEVAAAAARAGLKFVVFTDHGDGTRPPEPPAYHAGVLCLDGVEISTSGGHYAVFDMPPSPYPLAGEPRDVVEDVRRLGGFGIAAHPDSPKLQLAWTDWATQFDAIELLNPDTSWRILAARSDWMSRRRLATALLDYPFRAPEVMAGLLQPTGVIARWAAAASLRRVVTLAGADAHARLALRGPDPGEGGGLALPLPGYEPSFRVLSVHVRTERPLTDDPHADASLVAQAVRNGHLYTAVDGLASPPSFDFTATNAVGSVGGGDNLDAGGRIELHVTSNAPPRFLTVVRNGTQTLSSARDAQNLVVHGSDAPGVYWVEIVDPDRNPPIVWIRSNPVYVRGASVTSPSASTSAPTHRGPLLDTQSTRDWMLEHDRRSVAAFDVTADGAVSELRYQYALGSGPPAGQYTSLVRSMPNGIGDFDRLSFVVRSDRPMRMSIQIRDKTADRWQRSIYVDGLRREHSVLFEDFRPVGTTHAVTPRNEEFRSVLLVVDTTNTKPGASGTIWISDPRFEK
jgi:hypothetical protein